MATNSVSLLRFEPITRDQFASVSLQLPADRFAKTFLAKADAFGLWAGSVGAFLPEGLAAAIIFRLGRQKPIVANLELLHTFAVHRRKGVARQLVLHEYHRVSAFADYFRVSAEPEAVAFYRDLGLRFWGKQKSGCLLCMHKVCGRQPGTATYVSTDPVILGAVNSGRKGAVVEHFAEGPC